MKLCTPLQYAGNDRLGAEELLLGAMQDADVYRAWVRYSQLLADDTLLATPALDRRVRDLVPPGTRLPAPAGPTRAELVQLLTA